MLAAVQAELDKVVHTLGDFYARETHLLDQDLGERALTHRLAVHLESRFPGWDVDCDYNRLGERRLRLPKASIISTDDDSGKSVFPDIIVHRRTVPENLLAIELRKATNHQPPEHDRHKLRAMTDPLLWYAFRAGVMLTLARKNVAASEVYAGGVVDAPLSSWLFGRLAEAGLS
ncbi:hypothetical protein [Bradyrhizobium sp.]|uniref:hypothetical protein n=1 Tax=Bradyrhizobium sp. TaxID=376 RepID=UPI0026108625|nr:hypothetical protein [Bradyrhizobium sp.]